MLYFSLSLKINKVVAHLKAAHNWVILWVDGLWQKKSLPTRVFKGKWCFNLSGTFCHDHEFAHACIRTQIFPQFVLEMSPSVSPRFSFLPLRHSVWNSYQCLVSLGLIIRRVFPPPCCSLCSPFPPLLVGRDGRMGRIKKTTIASRRMQSV